ncbi:MAG: hypothetical protein RI967_2622 [Planctomycetota bacterium]
MSTEAGVPWRNGSPRVLATSNGLFLAAFAVASATAAVAAPRSAPPRFVDEARARGVSYVVTDGAFGGSGQYGCGVALCDLDGDGDDDLVALGGASGRIGVFENDGVAHFTDRTLETGIPQLLRSSGIVAADYDGDGDLDLFLTRWMQTARLFRNDGGFRFTDVTLAAGLGGLSGPGSGSSFGDFDGDGDLDLAVGIRTGTLNNLGRNRFYRNDGDGTFTNIAAELGVDDAFATFHCLLQDLDRDGDCDLYVSNDKGTGGGAWNRYFRNEGGAFVDERDNGACAEMDSMGVFAGDLDGNGFDDIFCTNIAIGHVLLATDDAQSYVEAQDDAQVDGDTSGWGTLMFDPDNDGDLDLFALSTSPQPDYLWMNDGGYPLVERGAEAGIDERDDSYCLAASDLDHDNRVDLLVQSHTVNLRLWMNASEDVGRALRVRVIGRGANTHAVGALVDVESEGGAGVVRANRQVLAGTSYKSQSSYALHVGLGDAVRAERVVVRWPRLLADGAGWVTRTIVDLPASEPGAEPWPIHPPERLGDAEGDGRVDPDDLAAAAACAKSALAPACLVFDLDGDADIDGADLAAMRVRMCDLDGSGHVAAPDLAILIGAWGTADADLTGDARVDAADLALLLANWS